MRGPRYGAQVADQLDYSCFAGSGVFLSTPSDLVRFGMAINGGKLLQPATVRLLQTPLQLPSGQSTGYGLGWRIENVMLGGTQTRRAGYEGKVLGGSAVSLITFPERGMAVAVVSNQPYGDPLSLAMRIAPVFAR